MTLGLKINKTIQPPGKFPEDQLRSCTCWHHSLGRSPLTAASLESPVLSGFRLETHLKMEGERQLRTSNTVWCSHLKRQSHSTMTNSSRTPTFHHKDKAQCSGPPLTVRKLSTAPKPRHLLLVPGWEAVAQQPSPILKLSRRT